MLTTWRLRWVFCFVLVCAAACAKDPPSSGNGAPDAGRDADASASSGGGGAQLDAEAGSSEGGGQVDASSADAANHDAAIALIRDATLHDGGGPPVLEAGPTAADGSSATEGAASTRSEGGLDGGPSDTDTSWTLTSPSGTVRATVQLADKGGTADYPTGRTRLYYRVEVSGPAGFAEVLADSPLGLTRADQGFVDGLAFDTASQVSVIDEPYVMVTGKRSSIRNPARERTLAYRTSTGSRVELVIRAYDDGFAFRYRFPETSATSYTVASEATGFRVPTGSRGFLLPYDVAGMYTPGYEAFWQSDIAAGTAAPAMTAGWCMPALFRTPANHWVLLAETDVDGKYFGAHLDVTPSSLVYRVALPGAAEANGVGVVTPSSTLPWQTPWRVVIAGASPRAIVESTLTTDLARPPATADWSWVRPGRVSWSWWSDDISSADYNRLVPFVDLAATMGWEYSLVDVNWHVMTNGTWQGLNTYAAAKNVGLFLWYSSGGMNNAVAQYGPRDRMNDAVRRRTEFQTISQAGIKGVKIDFFLSDKPWMMQYYLDILRDAAEYKLLVNFHGATVPRGWQRTYPNLMTMESVRGAEEYKYTAAYPAGQPARNTLLPFTRNVVGSMDFTPVTFTDALYPHVTTHAHELALSVLFESGAQHFADRVSGYTTLPVGPRTFLQQVPVAWDDTRYLDGLPGQSVALARRKGTAWYVAGINGEAQSRTFALPLAFVGPGEFDLALITDGASDRTFAEQTAVVSATSVLSAVTRPRGGFAARLTPRPAP